VQDELLESARAVARTYVEPLSKYFGQAAVSYDVTGGEISKKVAELADSWNADLIILGSHGRTGIPGLFMGSVSRAVLLQSRSSVLIVKLPDGSKSNAGARLGAPGRVLVPVDDSQYSLAVIDAIMESPWPDNCRFRLLSAVPPITAHQPELSALNTLNRLERKQRQEAIADLVLRTNAQKLAHHFDRQKIESNAVEGDPRKMILDDAHRWQADLIVIGSHGRRGFSRILMGSVSEAVAIHSPCSVQIVKRPSN